MYHHTVIPWNIEVRIEHYFASHLTLKRIHMIQNGITYTSTYDIAFIN